MQNVFPQPPSNQPRLWLVGLLCLHSADLHRTICRMEFRTRLNGPVDRQTRSCAFSPILLPLSTRLSLTLLAGSGQCFQPIQGQIPPPCYRRVG